MKYKLNLELEKIEWNQEAVKNNPFISALVATGILIPVEEKEWPQIGDKYWRISSKAMVCADTFNQAQKHIWRKASGNIFRTQKEAGYHRDQILNKSV